MCLGSGKNCFISHKVLGEPTWAPSYVMVSVIDQNVGLAMELPVIWAKSKLQLDIQNYKFLKINTKWIKNSLAVWLGELYSDIMYAFLLFLHNSKIVHSFK